jgi:NitT/TauT family transport system substrate-binding protein
MPTRRSFSKLLAIAVLVSTGLAGCRSRSPAETPAIRLGYLPLTDHLTVLASGRTTFQRARVEPVKFSTWPELAEALKAGQIEAAFALTPIALTLKQKGVPLKLVLLGSVLTAAPDVASVADLRGKAIAIPSRFSTHNLLLHRLLAKEGLDADRDVQIVEMPPPEMVQALATKRIAAFIVAEPFGAQAELKGVGKVLALSKDVWPDHICCALVVREDVAARHPEAVQELVNALVSAGGFIESHPQEAAEASRPYLGQDPSVIRHALTSPPGRVTYADLQPRTADLEATQADMLRYGVSTARVDVASFLDDRFARQAYGR